MIRIGPFVWMRRVELEAVLRGWANDAIEVSATMAYQLALAAELRRADGSYPHRSEPIAVEAALLRLRVAPDRASPAARDPKSTEAWLLRSARHHAAAAAELLVGLEREEPFRSADLMMAGQKLELAAGMLARARRGAFHWFDVFAGDPAKSDARPTP